jgi:hypothetical protein
MKKLFSNLAFLSILGSLLIFLSNCNEEKTSNSTLVGVWDVTNVEYDSYIGSMTVEEYYLNELGLTPQQTAIAMSLFNDEVTSYLSSTLIEFEADFWYWTNIGDPAGDEGTWSINDSETVIILDEGTIWENPITVNSLTSTSLNISFTMEEEVDLDDDPQTPDVMVTFDIAMTLSK